MFYISVVIPVIIIISAIIYIRRKQKFNKVEAEIEINFIDFKDKKNFFNEITVELQNNIIYKNKINEKKLIIPIFMFKKKKIIYGQITILNSNVKVEKTFKISIYKNYINDINIKINNKNKIYYYSEIIFYGDNLEKKIKLNSIFNYNNFGLKKRIRVIICNIDKRELMKIIKDNNKNNEFNKYIHNVLKYNSKTNLLINIFIGGQNSNILMFKENDEKLIIPTKTEKKQFERFYKQINGYNLCSKCSLFKKSLYEKENLFGISLINKDNKEKNEIYNSFINQGIDCLLDNDIITKKDKNFILGYLILLIYISERKEIMTTLYFNLHIFIEILKGEKFNEIEQIKIAISYVFFSLNNNERLNLSFTKDLEEDNPYLEAFIFYENIIKELNEESEIMLIFLKINSGFGIELLNGKECYKISMISIDEIKSHLLMNIPKYFFYFYSYNNHYILSDQRTQILAFNEEELFDFNNFNLQNNIMNIVIAMFHESSHQKSKLLMNEGSKDTPIMYLNKSYELQIQKNNEKKEDINVGKCVDNYLYGYGLNTCLLILSGNSYKLMDKKLFLGNLYNLNKIANQIVTDYLNKNPDIKSLVLKNNSLKNIFKIKKKKIELDNDYIIINGHKFRWTLSINSCLNINE